VLAFVILALSANLAAANEGGGFGLDVVPYDPGLPSDELPPLPSPWSFE
jgi:hypothetical protein